MKKLILILLMFSLLPLTIAAGDNWKLYFSDGITTVNGTDICVDDGTCLSDTAGAAGDITAVNTAGNYLTGGADTGVVSLLINETYLNLTIASLAGSGNSSWNETYADTLYYDLGNSFSYYNSTNPQPGSNSSWNETHADTLYYDISNPYGFWNSTFALFNKTYADTLYADISVTGDNSSWNETHADTLYYDISNPYGFWNSTYALFNKTYADTLYASIGSGNSSWNETLADTLYYDLGNSYGYYNSTDFNITDYYLLSNPYGYWNSTSALFNKTYADTLYADISVTGDNSSWNETHADTLYEEIDSSLHMNQDNWYNDSNGYMNWDGDSLEFNTTKMEVEYFNASAIQVVTGTGAGVIANLQEYDKITYNVSEVSSDFELRVNFTGITEFTTLLVRHKTDSDKNHLAAISIWDYTSNDWEGYGFLSEELTSEMQTFGVYDDTDHISDGIVQVRFYQVEGKEDTHTHQFDWVSLSKGFGTPVGTEIDPLSFHKDTNINNSGYNISADYFFGDGSELTNIEGGNSSWNETHADTLYYDMSNPYGFWNSTFALFNKTYADTLYYDLGNSYGYYNSTNPPSGSNSSWNETHADTLYYDLGNSYSYYNSTNPQPGTNASWNETHANTLYYDISNPYGFWNSTFALFNKSYADTLYYDLGNSYGYYNSTNPPSGSNSSWNETHADTLYADISVTGDNSSWNETHADTLYADISVTGDNSSWNETHADTLYADISVTGDNSSWNETHADTLYADIGVTGDNSSWNETHADTLYYDIGNSYGYWNDTFATFNKTYADTLYASTGAGNSSWNETYANTLYRLQSWDNITGLPTATPSDGDTTHLSLADEIYDWVIGLGYSLVGFTTDQNNELNTTGSPIFVNVSVETLYGNGDPDTYINWTGATGDQLEIFAGGVSFIHLIEGAGDGITFNQDSNDIDWRIETDTLTHGLALDGGTNKVRMENYSSCTYVSTDATGILACETGAIGSDNSSWNETHADTLYYDISNPYGFWNSTFALFNKTYADTLYYDLGNSYGYWNDTFATFNKTYADTLYASTGAGNSSWNETHADTLYYDLGNSFSYYNSTNPQPDSNYTEDEIEAFIFDDDNTANLNMSTYNITMGLCNQYWNGTCLFVSCPTTTSIQC